jgi:kynureninase
LEIIQQAGIERIREHSVNLTTRLLQLVEERGYHSISSRDPARRGGTIAVAVPEAKHVARTLKARDFVIDYRPGAGIRMSPHFYSTADEVDALVEELDRVVRTRDYDVSEPFTSLVT